MKNYLRLVEAWLWLVEKLFVLSINCSKSRLSVCGDVPLSHTLLADGKCMVNIYIVWKWPRYPLDIFLQLLFQSLCFLTCGKSLTDLSTYKVFFVFLPKYLHYLPFIYPFSWWSDHSSGTSEMQRALCLTCCPLPSPALQSVMLLVPSWYSSST